MNEKPTCSECGATVEVDETTAAHPDPVTCDDCEHDCLNPEANHLRHCGDDPALPAHIIPYTCDVCGQFWEFDVETGQHHADN